MSGRRWYNQCRSAFGIAAALLVFGVADLRPSYAAEVVVTRLDGTTVGGELRAWNETEIVLGGPTGEQRVPADQLMSVRWPQSSDAPKASTTSAGIVELTDGTQLPFSTLIVASSNASLKCQLPEDSHEMTISVPAGKLAVVRFQHLTDALAQQWEEIRQQKLASDALVVVKKDGKSLDYVEGAVGEVSAEKIEFKIDDETNRVDLGKVAGIIYYRTANGKTAETKAMLTGATGLRVSAAKFAIEGKHVNITTTGGVALDWPVDDLQSADFSSGKLLYLSDLEPASQSCTPTVGLPPSAAIALQYGQPRRDHSAFGDALTLLDHDPDDATAPLAVRRTYTKGLALRSRTELVYRLPAGFSRFTALAGIDPATTATGNLRLNVLADDRPLLETEVAGGQAPQPIDVQITGAKRLKLLVDFGQNLDTGDWLNLCDAKIVK